MITNGDKLVWTGDTYRNHEGKLGEEVDLDRISEDIVLVVGKPYTDRRNL
jgi:hypothetical protein